MFPENKRPVASLFSKPKRPKKGLLRRIILVLWAVIFLAIITAGILVYAHLKKNTPPLPTRPTTETTGQPGSSSNPTGETPATTTNQPAAAAEQKTTDKKATASGGTGATGASGGTSGNTGGSGGTSCAGGSHTPGGSDGNGGCWPGAHNTGVPAGTVLGAYSGPTSITTPGTTITGKTINSDLFIYTSNVTIRNSVINGHIDVDGPSYSLTIEDSEVNAGATSAPALGYNDITVRRVEFTGGQHAVLCAGDCVVEDSWLHDQYNQPGGTFHNNAFISNGGSNMTLTHNTLHCSPEDNGTGGGCTADISLFGDFAPIANIAVNNNLLMATPSGGYCGSFGYNPGKTYGGNPTNVDITNNIFQLGPNNKCGVYGPATSFLNANGNSWSGNKYTDGSVVNY
jgi:hypothetical protein